MTRGRVPQPGEYVRHEAFLDAFQRWSMGEPVRKPVRLKTYVAVGLFLAACVALGWYLLDGRVP